MVCKVHTKDEISSEIVKRMEDKVRNHEAWNESRSLSEVIESLTHKASFTYVICPGMDKHHFFLVYVDSLKIVKVKNIRIMKVKGKSCYKNGVGILFDSLEHLIPCCMKCLPAELKVLGHCLAA